MRHTDDELETAAERFEKWADELDVSKAKVTDLAELRAIAKANDAKKKVELDLLKKVEQARKKGYSWNKIADALGTTRQAARQKYQDKISA